MDVFITPRIKIMLFFFKFIGNGRRLQTHTIDVTDKHSQENAESPSSLSSLHEALIKTLLNPLKYQILLALVYQLNAV